LRRRDRPVESWLDVGSGDGWTATRLRERLFPESRLECWDIHYSDEYLATLSWADGKRVIATRQPSDGPFDLITAFDVLEHVEDDRAMLDHIREKLRPDGWFAMSVPAWPFLFGEHDRFLRHVRRYRPKEASALIKDAGFEILAEGGLFHSLLVVRIVERAIQIALRQTSGKSRGPIWHAPDWITEIVEGALALDGALSRGSSERHVLLPGLTYWAVCVPR
jgi:SAM-dependent methyltransferase